MDRLDAWEIEVNGLCKLCHQEHESRDHLFFYCPFSRHIWRNILLLCVDFGRNVLGWEEELKSAVLRLKGKALISILLRICWSTCIYLCGKKETEEFFRICLKQLDQILEKVKEIVIGFFFFLA